MGKVEEARSKFLSKVEEIVNNNRNAEYGSAEDSFNTIADFWNTYLEARGFKYVGVNALDVASMLDLLKTARIASNQSHLDSWIDKAGYSACGGGILVEMEIKKEEFVNAIEGVVGRGSTSKKPSKVSPDKTLKEDTIYTFVECTHSEGEVWQILSLPARLVESELSIYAGYNSIHSLRTNSGRVWDVINGWRSIK